MFFGVAGYVVYDRARYAIYCKGGAAVVMLCLAPLAVPYCHFSYQEKDNKC